MTLKHKRVISVSHLPQLFAEDLWIVDGPVVTSFGFRYGTRMSIIKLKQGGLFVWSPVSLSPHLKNAIDDLGVVRAIIAPNSLHHLWVPEWQLAYPAAHTFAAPGLAARRKDIAFDGELGDTPSPIWGDDIDQVIMRGNTITTEVVFFHRTSGTVLFTDLLQNFPPDWFSGWRKIVARLDLMIGDQPQVPRKFRIAFTDKKAAREALARISQWPAQRVLMAHGTPAETNGAAFIHHAFRWLS